MRALRFLFPCGKCAEEQNKRMCTMRETLTASRCAAALLQLCLLQVYSIHAQLFKTTTCCVQTQFVLIRLHLQHHGSTQTPASHDEGYIRRHRCPTSRCECFTTSQRSQGWFGEGAQIIKEKSCGVFVDFCIKCETFKLQELLTTLRLLLELCLNCVLFIVFCWGLSSPIESFSFL